MRLRSRRWDFEIEWMLLEFNSSCYYYCLIVGYYCCCNNYTLNDYQPTTSTIRFTINTNSGTSRPDMPLFETRWQVVVVVDDVANTPDGFNTRMSWHNVLHGLMSVTSVWCVSVYIMCVFRIAPVLLFVAQSEAFGWLDQMHIGPSSLWIYNLHWMNWNKIWWLNMEDYIPISKRIFALNRTIKLPLKINSSFWIQTDSN